MFFFLQACKLCRKEFFPVGIVLSVSEKLFFGEQFFPEVLVDAFFQFSDSNLCAMMGASFSNV